MAFSDPPSPLPGLGLYFLYFTLMRLPMHHHLLSLSPQPFEGWNGVPLTSLSLM